MDAASDGDAALERHGATSLERLRPICLALPEATETPMMGAFASFQVRGKRFAWHMVDHHGNGRVELHCKAPDGMQAALVGAHSERYYVPPYVGHRGWVGAWLDIEGVDWDQVADLVEAGYRMTAPKRLLAQLDQP